MKITLNSTSQIVYLNGVHARVWIGTSERGTKIFAFVTRLAVHVEADAIELETELIETRPVTTTERWPLNMIL